MPLWLVVMVAHILLGTLLVGLGCVRVLFSGGGGPIVWVWRRWVGGVRREPQSSEVEQDGRDEGGLEREMREGMEKLRSR